MKYVIQGAKVTNCYGVKEYDNWQPTFKIVKVDKEWVDILEIECDNVPCNLDLSETYSSDNFSINLSEEECVNVLSRTFRADLNKTILQTSKVVSSKDDTSLREDYKQKLDEYYNKIIETYPKVKEHIELYNIKDAKENIDKIKSTVLKESEYICCHADLAFTSNDWSSVTMCNLPLQLTEL